MDIMRERHINEMNRLKEAIEKSNSDYLKRDYTKAYKKMQKELEEYDSYKCPKN